MNRVFLCRGLALRKTIPFFVAPASGRRGRRPCERNYSVWVERGFVFWISWGGHPCPPRETFLFHHWIPPWIRSGVHRNDKKQRCPKFVSPAKDGVQSKGFKRTSPRMGDVCPIMDSLVNTLFLKDRFGDHGVNPFIDVYDLGYS